jgi:hypothetical protein
VYDWDTAAAHAQTPNNSEGVPTQSAAQAEKESVHYLEQKAREFRTELEAGHTGNALYVLGYALHTIQDLASHEGRTNYEHSWLAFGTPAGDLRPPADVSPNTTLRGVPPRPDRNPDASFENVDRAKRWTTDFLTTVQRNIHPCAWERLKAFTHRSSEADHKNEIPNFAYKKETFVWSDSGVADYARYWSLHFIPPDVPKLVRWQPLDSIATELTNAFAGNLRGQDDLAWLVQGVWSVTWIKDQIKGVDKIKVWKDVGGYQYSWGNPTPIFRKASMLVAEIPLTSKDLADAGLPRIVAKKVLGLAKRYRTYTLSEDTCLMTLKTEQDNIKWWSDRIVMPIVPIPVDIPDGRFEIVPKDPKFLKEATLRWQEDIP